jgi:NTP pyrophosphatase (non-canonical NTP hydrolase)
MTIDEYGQWAAGDRSFGQSRDERLIYCALGLFGEAGEIADTIRKMMREGALDEDYLVYELGDVLYHCACLVAELGQTPSGNARTKPQQHRGAACRRAAARRGKLAGRRSRRHQMLGLHH